MDRHRHRDLRRRTGGSERLLPARSRHPRRHRRRRAQCLFQDLRLGPRSAGRVRRNFRPRRDSPAAPSASIQPRPHGSHRRRLDARTISQPRGLSRRARLRRSARSERALSPEERHRGAESEDAASASRDCRTRRGRTIRSGIEGGARSRLRGARSAAVPENQGGGRGARRQGDCRALRGRHRRRYAAARLLHDQVGGQRADRHPYATGPRHAVDAGADTGMARRRRSTARDRGRASHAHDDVASIWTKPIPASIHPAGCFCRTTRRPMP